MKKLLLILAIGTFAACGDSTSETSTEETTVDTSSTMMAPAPATTDTAAMGADTARMGTDTATVK